MQADLTVVQDKLVYDITRNNHCESGSEGGDCAAANDWFESRLAEPDVLLEDLINIITPEAHPVCTVQCTSILGHSSQPVLVSTISSSCYVIAFVRSYVYVLDIIPRAV